VGKSCLDFHCQKTGERVFLNIKQKRRSVETEAADQAATIADAINQATKSSLIQFDSTYQLVIMTDNGATSIPLEVDDDKTVRTVLPGTVAKAIDGILKANDAAVAADLAMFKDEMVETKYHKDLPQEATGRKISPNKDEWKCDKTGDTIGEGPGKTASLWLNLSDGFIGGGRRNWDGSGGNNTALDHYQEMLAQGKNYPLAVKLGTISADGADVYSYAADENDSVTIPLERLAHLLRHWGIDILAMVKTEQSMQEMTLELNKSWDFGRITGDNVGEVVYGAGCTGIQNMGNTCYMNSVLQTLFVLPDFKSYYAEQYHAFRQGSVDPTTDLRFQLSKIGQSLWSGEYSVPPSDGIEGGIRPKLFKQIIGKGHPEFSSSRQQDASEFLVHLLTQIERTDRQGTPPINSFKCNMEERYEDITTQQVCYKSRENTVLSLALPVDQATNMTEVAAYEQAKAAAGAKAHELRAVVPDIPFASVLDNWKSEELLQFRGAAAKKCTRFATFPDNLVVHVAREVIGDNWVPKKLDVTMMMPQQLDLEALRARGLQPSEVPMAEEAAAPMQGMQVDSKPVNEEALALLLSMGFDQAKCEKALRETDNNAERATDWIFSHMDDDMQTDAPAAAAATAVADGPGQYQLVAFISHIGKQVTSGHYVCHVNTANGWCIFNDEKVQQCPSPPFDCGYLYFYRRAK
jgi:ubiquitin carboxyl-terminal hydrolase 5/13